MITSPPYLTARGGTAQPAGTRSGGLSFSAPGAGRPRASRICPLHPHERVYEAADDVVCLPCGKVLDAWAVINVLGLVVAESAADPKCDVKRAWRAKQAAMVGRPVPPRARKAWQEQRARRLALRALREAA